MTTLFNSNASDDSNKGAARKAELKMSNFFGATDKKLTNDVIFKKLKSYDGRYTWDDYSALLKELSKNRYKIVPLKDFADTQASDKIIVSMRHDIDVRPDKALKMAEIEKEMNIPSTYFILHSARYYGKVKNGVMHRTQGVDDLAGQLYKDGFEIGIHTDLFTMMWNYQFDPASFIQEEIKYYAKLGIPVCGTAAHGNSTVIRRKLNNVWIYSEFGHKGNINVKGIEYPYGDKSFKDFGIKYEAYLLKKDTYTGDIDRRFKEKPIADLIYFIAKLRSPSKLIILTHPVHWGKSK
jgi:hypothetical protein